MGSSRLPESLGVPPIGRVIGERKNVLPKTLLGEILLAGGRHLAEPVVVSAAVVDRHKAHGHDAAWSRGVGVGLGGWVRFTPKVLCYDPI